MGRRKGKSVIELPDGEQIKRVVNHTMLGNWSFATVRHKGKEWLVEKSGSLYKVKRALKKRKR